MLLTEPKTKGFIKNIIGVKIPCSVQGSDRYNEPFIRKKWDRTINQPFRTECTSKCR